MDWADIGEFGLIGHIRVIAGEPPPPLLKGIGDDAAVIALSSGMLLLVSTDAMVEGRHFRRHWMSPRQIGARAAAAAFSDIAAMGGTPTCLLCTLCISPPWTVEEVEELVKGAHRLAHHFGVSLAGGDVVSVRDPQGGGSGQPLMIDMVAVGQTDRSRLWLREGARVGDRVLVTGTLGSPAAALALLESPHRRLRNRFPLLMRHLTSPLPRLDAAAALAPLQAVHAAIDISDGLLQDAEHVATASGAAIELHAASIPVNRQLLDCAALLAVNPLHWAATGGEDFELLLTAPPDRVPELEAAIRPAALPLTDIGQVTTGSGVRLLDESNQALDIGSTGWNHFRS